MRSRPAHLQPSLVAFVVCGGMVGTTMRALIEHRFGSGDAGRFPWETFAVNVSGALLLGALLELLALLGPDQGLRRALRLGLGTGLLGGYTTYSSFAVQTVALGESGQVGTALIYDASSLLAGFLAAALAMVAARRVVTRRFESETT